MQVVAGHQPGGEEALGRPRALEQVRQRPVAEDVDEEPCRPGSSQPAMRSQQLAASCACARTSRSTSRGQSAPSGANVVDVGGDHRQVRQARARVALGLDPLPLARRVRDADDRRRAGSARPATATASPSRSRGRGSASRRRTCARSHVSASIASSASASVATPVGPQAPRVLAPRPQDQPQELGRQLVVLLVGLLGRPRRSGRWTSAPPARAAGRCWPTTPPRDSRRSRAQAPYSEPGAQHRVGEQRRAPARGRAIGSEGSKSSRALGLFCVA